MAEHEAAKVVYKLLINELRNHLKNNKKKRHAWVCDWLKKQNTLGTTNSICRELSLEDQNSYRNFFTKEPNLFWFSLNKVKATIQKKYTNMRRPIPPESKLQDTLRFLATGDLFASLQYLFRIPKNTTRTIIPEVVGVIYNASHKNKYITKLFLYAKKKKKMFI